MDEYTELWKLNKVGVYVREEEDLFKKRKSWGFWCKYRETLDIKGSGGRKNNRVENFQHLTLDILQYEKL